jgi:TRAP-type C4-dicarboxylate transport system permease small subunit
VTRLAAAVDRLDRFVGRAIAAVSGVGAGVALVAMATLVVVGVVSRSVLNISLPFTIEYAEYLVPVVGLGAAAYALRQDSHVRADLVLGSLPARFRWWLMLLGDVGGLAYLVVLIVYTLDTAVVSISRGDTSIYPSATPYGYWQLLIPFSLILFALQLVLTVVGQIAHPSEPPARGPGDAL